MKKILIIELAKGFRHLFITIFSILANFMIVVLNIFYFFIKTKFKKENHKLKTK